MAARKPLVIVSGRIQEQPEGDSPAGAEPAIAAPVSAPTEKYWRGDKTWSDFFTNVRAATLTGLSTATSAVVAATDTVLAAIGKLQAQVDNKFDTGGGYISGPVTVAGDILAYGVLGYGEGSGGTTQQWGTVSTAVTLNTPNGVITLASDNISAGDWIKFTLHNNLITEGSIVIAHGMFDGTGPSIEWLTVRVEYVRFGQAVISVKNFCEVTVSTDDVKIKFVVFAGSTS